MWLMRILWLSPILIILLTAGCETAQYEWRKDGANEVNLKADFESCREIAIQLPRAGDAQLSENYTHCMVDRGWYLKRISGW